MIQTYGVDSEVGPLRTVMLHRPGQELRRLTPRNNDKLLFDGIPWVGRAQDEHDAFAQALRDRGVEVLYLGELLTESLADEQARARAVSGATEDLRLGDTLRQLPDRPPGGPRAGAAGRGTLMAGIRNDEVRAGSLVTSLLAHEDFLIDPLPNLLFTRDSSVWIRDSVAVTSLAMPARARESQLTELIYAFHPRFAGVDKDVRPPARARRGWRRTGARPGRTRGRGRRADDAGRRRAAGPAGLRRRAWRTPCSRCRSRSSGPPCTWTPSARWSTSTPC